MLFDLCPVFFDGGVGEYHVIVERCRTFCANVLLSFCGCKVGDEGTGNRDPHHFLVLSLLHNPE